MAVLEVKAEVADAYLAMLNTLRGGIPLEEYLRLALTLGLGHLQEEVIHQQRQKIYERLAIVSEGYHAALNVQRLEPVPRVVNGPRLAHPEA
jgi:hypothetical protein